MGSLTSAGLPLLTKALVDIHARTRDIVFHEKHDVLVALVPGWNHPFSPLKTPVVKGVAHHGLFHDECFYFPRRMDSPSETRI